MCATFRRQNSKVDFQVEYTDMLTTSRSCNMCDSKAEKDNLIDYLMVLSVVGAGWHVRYEWNFDERILSVRIEKPNELIFLGIFFGVGVCFSVVRNSVSARFIACHCSSHFGVKHVSNVVRLSTLSTEVNSTSSESLGLSSFTFFTSLPLARSRFHRCFKLSVEILVENSWKLYPQVMAWEEEKQAG